MERRRPASTSRSLAREGFAIVLALLALWLVLAPGAHAAPAFDPPLGWAEGTAADAAARDRAQAWADAWSADVRQVMSTRSDDGFAETLAVLEVPAPIPAEALGGIEAGRAWLEPRVTAALGSTATLEGDGVELRPRNEPGVAVLVARVRQGDRIARLAVAPTGARHLAVVLLMPRAEEVLHASIFDAAIDGLQGLRRPIAPLRRGLWRTIAVLAWLAVGGAVAIEWTRRSLPRPGARAAGRQIAAVLFVAAVIVLVIAGVLLSDRTVELALAGGTPWGFALELTMGGAVAAVLVLAATELWERRLQPVASAPEAGSFARTTLAPHRAGASLLHSTGSQPRLAITGDTHVGRPPAITGDTHVGRPPAITGDTQVGRPPAITGDTQVGRPPAVTGNTQVGPPPAVTGNTKVGPPPKPIPVEGYEAGPPVREIISGDIEVQTQVRRVPEPDTVKTAAPVPDTVKTSPPQPEPAQPAAPRNPARPDLEIDWS